MISITPNLRAIKPLTKYMEKRVRMYGRQRFANTLTRNSSNQKTITLWWTPYSSELVEIYFNDIRMIDGYTIEGNLITFTDILNGKIDIIDDRVFPDMKEKWLILSIKNLLHGTDLDNTSFGTDRRPEYQIAQHCRPVAMTQGAIGFCRPGIDTDTLIYCSYYGMYGRDTITYAIKTDMGQYSDYRCIDIRVRDPNYIPTIRLCPVSKESRPMKVNGQVVDIVPNGTYQIYGESEVNTEIHLPNKTKPDEKTEYHFVIQGKDENGDWFELTEYFDPEEYTLTVPNNNEDFVVTFVGESVEFGFENAVRISIVALKNSPEPITITLVNHERELDLFSGTIYSSGVITEQLPISIVPGSAVVLDKDVNGMYVPPIVYPPVIPVYPPIDPENPDAVLEPIPPDPDIIIEPLPPEPDPAMWELVGEPIGIDGVNLNTTFTSPFFETRVVRATLNASLSVPEALYDPIAKTIRETVYDVSHVFEGSFTTSEDSADREVEKEADSEFPLIAGGFYWGSADPYSPMYLADEHRYYYKLNWTIT